ncbi:hypothetical protein ACFYWX_31880 [Streptomyces sp. NPDC002888]|uniref:hypothetical protein n=1 Tax=Streptomyces sp. NPDC002888 TaxID=3364668 RepID=UPI00367EB639
MSARVTALGQQVDGLDNHWTADFARQGKTVVHTLRGKHPRAHEVSPITLTLAGSGPLAPDVAKAVRRSLGYGLPEEVVLPRGAVESLTVSGPEWLSRAHRDVEVRWQPADKVPLAETAAEVVFLDGEQVTASYPGTLAHVGRGSVGRSVTVGLDGGMELMIPDACSAPASLRFTEDGRVPKEQGVQQSQRRRGGGDPGGHGVRSVRQRSGGAVAQPAQQPVESVRAMSHQVLERPGQRRANGDHRDAVAAVADAARYERVDRVRSCFAQLIGPGPDHVLPDRERVQGGVDPAGGTASRACGTAEFMAEQSEPLVRCEGLPEREALHQHAAPARADTQEAGAVPRVDGDQVHRPGAELGGDPVGDREQAGRRGAVESVLRCPPETWAQRQGDQQFDGTQDPLRQVTCHQQPGARPRESDGDQVDRRGERERAVQSGIPWHGSGSVRQRALVGAFLTGRSTGPGPAALVRAGRVKVPVAGPTPDAEPGVRGWKCRAALGT